MGIFASGKALWTSLLFALVMIQSQELLETGNFAQFGTIPSSNEIKVVSYNIRWRSGKDLEKLIALLKNDPHIGKADIVCLQEIDRNKKRTSFTNTAQLIARELKWNYVWAAPPSPSEKDNKKKILEEETGVAILSPYDITDVESILLPNPGPSGRRRVAIGATVQIGIHSIRVYSVHTEIRISTEKKMQQLATILESLPRRSAIKKTLIMGDFNTLDNILGDDKHACIKLFEKHGFNTPIPHDQSTWKAFVLKLKLDWIWIKGFESSEGGIAEHIKLSDHKPLWARIRL